MSVFFFVVAIGAAGYFFYNTSFTLTDDTQSSTTSTNTTSSPDSSASQDTTSKTTEPTPVALPELTKAEAVQAQAHVKSITTEPEQPIEIKKADHFVTAEQVLELPELQAEIIKIETVNEASLETPKQVDVIISAPVKENEQVSLAQTNQNNAPSSSKFCR